MVINNLLLLTALAWATGTMLVVIYFVLVVEKLEPYHGADHLDWDYNPAVRADDRYPALEQVTFPIFANATQPRETTNLGKSYPVDCTGRLVLDIASV